jgi:hypothetical protein
MSLSICANLQHPFREFFFVPVMEMDHGVHSASLVSVAFYSNTTADIVRSSFLEQFMTYTLLNSEARYDDSTILGKVLPFWVSEYGSVTRFGVSIIPHPLHPARKTCFSPR